MVRSDDASIEFAAVLASVLSFTFAAAMVVLLPGPDTLVIVRSLVRGGRRAGIRTSVGVLSGLAVWVAAAALGLSALVQASRIGYEILTIVGACYLVLIGVQSLRSLRHVQTVGAIPEPPGRSGGYWAGLLTDLLNPKVGVLFVSFLPGFVPDGYSVGWTTLGLGGIFIVLTAAYCAALVAASGTVSSWMSTPSIRRRLDAITGLVLVGFGIKLATEA